MKRIVIFCDGTWNTPDEMDDGIYCQTNVVKMAKNLAPVSEDGNKQLLYYDTGIGSEGSAIKRIYDGATGHGISKNILQAYRFLIKNYESNDEIFLFGFSRGAFTVRSLSGLIRNSGILRFENIDKLQRAYDIYRSRKTTYQPRAVEATLFRRTFAVEEYTKIKFIGVWDTVGALGNPLILNGRISKRNQFHNTELSSRIENAFHALAVDEKRKNFKATLWHKQSDSKNQVLEQVWFPGVHSDVGGGYPKTESGLSDIALKWMLEKAQSCKLKFNLVEMHPETMAEKHESYKCFYKIMGRNLRTITANSTTNESLHRAVNEKHSKDGTYRPINLTNYFNQIKSGLKD